MTPNDPSSRGRFFVLAGLVAVAVVSIGVVVLRLNERPDEPGAKKPAAKGKTDPDKALSRLIGTWESETEVEPPEKERPNGVVEVKSVAGGKFMRIHTWVPGTASEWLTVLSFESGKKEFQSWFFDAGGEAGGPSEALWSPETQILTWKAFPRGHALVHELRLLNDTTIKSHLIVRDAAERVVREVRQTLTRIDPAKAPPVPKVIDPKRPKEIEVLESFLLGRWTTTSIHRKLKMPEESKLIATLDGHAILGGRFVEGGETTQPGDQEDHWLATFDADAKKYRFWHFGSSGLASQAEGLYDPGSATMTWKGVPKEDHRGTWKRIDANTQEVTITFLDGGEPAAELSGDRRREK